MNAWQRVKTNAKQVKPELTAMAVLIVVYLIFSWYLHNERWLFAIGTGITFFGGMQFRNMIIEKLEEQSEH